jgi:hypothetical protein
MYFYIKLPLEVDTRKKHVYFRVKLLFELTLQQLNRNLNLTSEFQRDGFSLRNLNNFSRQQPSLCGYCSAVLLCLHAHAFAWVSMLLLVC